MYTSRGLPTGKLTGRRPFSPSSDVPFKRNRHQFILQYSNVNNQCAYRYFLTFWEEFFLLLPPSQCTSLVIQLKMKLKCIAFHRYCWMINICITHGSNRLLWCSLLTILQARCLECNDRRFVAHITETLRQWFVLRTQIGQAERSKAGFFHLCLIERSLRLGAVQVAQATRRDSHIKLQSKSYVSMLTRSIVSSASCDWQYRASTVISPAVLCSSRVPFPGMTSPHRQ